MASISKYRDSNGTKWRVYSEHTDKRTGERKRRSKTFRVFKDAVAYRTEVEQQQVQGVNPTRTTVAAYLDAWAANKLAMGEVRQNTMDGYRGKLESAKMALGHIALVDLTASDVDAWMREMLSGQNTLSQKPLSPSSVKQARAILSGALEDAVRKRILPYNVVRSASVPKVHKRRKPAWTSAHVQAFLAELDKTPYGNFYRFIGLTGCRRSEAGGLLTSNVSFETRQVFIETTLMRVLGQGQSKWVLSEPKSETSRRTLPMSSPVEMVLRDQMRRNAEARLKVGSAWVDTGGVFVEPTGEFMNLDTLSSKARNIRLELGLPAASSIHGLRHHFARALNASGSVDPQTLRTLMGHAMFSQTLDYIAPSDDLERDAMDVFGSLLDNRDVG